MKMVAIGGFFHDFNAAACDLKTGRFATAEEERFSRIKHHKIMGAKETSIDCLRYCLSEISADFEDIEVVVLSDEEVHQLQPFIEKLFPNAKIAHVHHHMAHSALAYFSSGSDDAAILTLDGFGDGKSGLLAHGRGNAIEPIIFHDLENSIGLEYLRATFNLGLGSFGSEGKTQGLAAYGEPRFYEDYMNEIKFDGNGNITLSPKLKNMEGYMSGEHYIEEKSLFNDFILSQIDRRFPDEKYEQQHLDMAASIQKVLDTVGLEFAKVLAAKTDAKTLVISGGVALNSTMNGVIMNSGLFETVLPHPSSSDRGNALGALMYYLAHELDHRLDMDEPFVYGGQSFGDDEIKSAFASLGVNAKKLDDPAATAANWLAENNIVGWFQGRSELGARALGNRSILADPRQADNKDVLNAKVKHREWFRPFAPSVLAERQGEYFDTPYDLPHMTMTVMVRKEKHSVVPTITHEDGTARIQSVTVKQNPLYHRLISNFDQLTGVPLVVNTSFNDNDEPIVESPEDAILCFQKTGMDRLIVGSYAASKETTP
jgi:carbamoyltransferase